ncbi:transmembrane protein 19 [Nilaparvata lugens]|uniref:transmembrane protein 19 n=1 Tax=Nilaparvata lugens TaxID=108931 RepID=UPI000B997574|nr:transmembrane protein 19 [Nilaparvata lugens]
MRSEKKDNKAKSNEAINVLLILLFTLLLTVPLWLGHVAVSRFFIEDYESISPARLLASILIPILVATYGLRKNSLSISGAILGFLVGFILTLSSYLFFACLLTFFITSSRATKFRSEKKRKFEKDFKEGGQRNWLQVLCNSGMATQYALLYILDAGVGEYSIDFDTNYRASWLAIGILSAFACCNGDTWASELAPVLSNENPRLITSWKKVPKGTNGGVTVAGLALSLVGGLAVGVAFYAALVYTVDPIVLARSPPQWPCVLWAAFAGLFGSIVDSLLGATLQFSGFESHTKMVVEHAGPGIKRISGRMLLDNHSVNLLSSVITALVVPKLAHWFWP